jgi:hypothetical protein
LHGTNRIDRVIARGGELISAYGVVFAFVQFIQVVVDGFRSRGQEAGFLGHLSVDDEKVRHVALFVFLHYETDRPTSCDG